MVGLGNGQLIWAEGLAGSQEPMPVLAPAGAQHQLAAVVAQLAQVIEAAPLHLALAPTEEILLVQQQPTGRQGLGCGFRGQ